MDKIMGRPTGVSAVMLFLLSIALGAGPAHAVLSLYDDFNDPSNLVRSDLRDGDSRWFGSLSDTARVIDRIINFGDPANPKLLIGRRLVVPVGATTASDRAGLTLRNVPNPIAIQADVAMTLCSLGAAGLVQAGLQLYGFNDGTSGGPGDSTGDIFTRFRVSCITTNQAAITWTVFRCTNVACTTVTSLGTGSFGAANIGQEFTLNVTKSGSSFVFNALGQPQTFPVPGNPTAPPRVPFDGPRTRIDPTTPANGGEFAMIATFDDVMIDQ